MNNGIINETALLLNIGKRYKIKRRILAKSVIVRPLTLATLDLLIHKSLPLLMAEKPPFSAYLKTIPKVIAIAILGEKCFTCKNNTYTVRHKAINRMSRTIAHRFEISDCVQILTNILTHDNLNTYMQLYPPDQSKEDKEDRYRVLGCKSPYGRRASICKELCMDWDTLHHKIPYSTIQRMLLDLPRVDYSGKDDNEGIALTEENAEDIYKFLKKVNGK